jgi:hypothetical protein
VKGRLVPRAELGAGERAAMLALLQASFEGATPAVFERDLAEKDWALLLEDERGSLRGFSTLVLYASEASGEAVTVVYSGDTVVERGAWGSSALSRSWIGAVQTLARERPGRRVFWLLLTSGFRTYRFLPVFWRDFHPRSGAPMPGAQGRLDALARERFGDRYRDGIVRLDAPEPLRPALREVPESRLACPHVAFFLAKNPGWREGDELACLTEICPENLTAAGRRMWRAGLGS